MAVTHVETSTHDHIHPPPQGFISKYVFSFDHKVIAVQYFITSGLFFVLAGLLAELIRMQLMHAHNNVLSPHDLQRGVHVHGSAMVWLVIIPLLTGGFGNLVMPLQIGARDVAFPWLNMFSFWLFPPAGVLLFASFLSARREAGWTEYPPVCLQDRRASRCGASAIFLIGMSARSPASTSWSRSSRCARPA